MDKTLRAEMVRQATLTPSAMVAVSGHPDLVRQGGVAATLRFRL